MKNKKSYIAPAITVMASTEDSSLLAVSVSSEMPSGTTGNPPKSNGTGGDPATAGAKHLNVWE